MVEFGQSAETSRRRLAVIVGGVVVGVVLLGIIGWLLMRNSGGSAPSPLGSLPGLSGGQTDVELKTEYANPFERSTQYVNPFADYKSPFISLQ